MVMGQGRASGPAGRRKSRPRRPAPGFPSGLATRYVAGSGWRRGGRPASIFGAVRGAADPSPDPRPDPRPTGAQDRALPGKTRPKSRLPPASPQPLPAAAPARTPTPPGGRLAPAAPAPADCCPGGPPRAAPPPPPPPGPTPRPPRRAPPAPSLLSSEAVTGPCPPQPLRGASRPCPVPTFGPRTGFGHRLWSGRVVAPKGLPARGGKSRCRRGPSGGSLRASAPCLLIRGG